MKKTAFLLVGAFLFLMASPALPQDVKGAIKGALESATGGSGAGTGDGLPRQLSHAVPHASML